MDGMGSSAASSAVPVVRGYAVPAVLAGAAAGAITSLSLAHLPAVWGAPGWAGAVGVALPAFGFAAWWCRRYETDEPGAVRRLLGAILVAGAPGVVATACILLGPIPAHLLLGDQPQGWLDTDAGPALLAEALRQVGLAVTAAGLCALAVVGTAALAGALCAPASVRRSSERTGIGYFREAGVLAGTGLLLLLVVVPAVRPLLTSMRGSDPALASDRGLALAMSVPELSLHVALAWAFARLERLHLDSQFRGAGKEASRRWTRRVQVLIVVAAAAARLSLWDPLVTAIAAATWAATLTFAGFWKAEPVADPADANAHRDPERWSYLVLCSELLLDAARGYAVGAFAVTFGMAAGLGVVNHFATNPPAFGPTWVLSPEAIEVAKAETWTLILAPWATGTVMWVVLRRQMRRAARLNPVSP